jgi:hypothetical protein
MKKLLFLLLSFMLVLTLVACGDKPSEEIGPTCVSCDNLVSNEGETCSSCKAAQKLALYNKVIGSWRNKEPVDPGVPAYEHGERDIIVFEQYKITIGEDVFNFNPSSDLYLENEVPEDKRWKGETFYFYVNDRYYSLIQETDDEITVTFPYFENNKNKGAVGFFERVSDAGDNSDGDTGSLDFSLVGEWSYQINGSINTSLTINSDNTFDFVGGGSTSYSGTYSLSGNKITFEFDQNASMNIKDTFVVSGSDTEMTLTLEKSVSTYNGQENVSTSMSSLLQIFYNIITSTSVTLSK